MEKEIFESNVDKLKYTIKIDVYENCCGLGFVFESQKQINYHEIVGVLETQKNHLMLEQRERNLKKEMKIPNPAKKKKPNK